MILLEHLAAIVFALPCCLGIHTARHGRCLWCRKSLPRRGWTS